MFFKDKEDKEDIEYSDYIRITVPKSNKDRTIDIILEDEECMKCSNDIVLHFDADDDILFKEIHN